MSSKPGSQPRDHARHEALSPIKINYRAETIGSNITNIPHHRTPQRIIQHPHGISAKHDARRNTIGHNNSVRRRGLVNTPLVSSTAFRNPMTSPRLASRQPINLESIKRTKQHIDRQIKLAFPDENKENRKHLDLSSSDSEDPLSSPLKRSRNHQDKVGGDLLHPSKIPKISFDKGDAEVVETQVDKEVDEEELIKEDFVELNRPTDVIDEDDDDDDDEDEERNLPKLSQSLEHTQINKIIREHKNDYVTPERMTEPVAKSPETHQNIRVIEQDRTENFAKYKDNTSPSKRGNDEVVDGEDTANLSLRQLEDEPTINFLMSPNSKPVFSKNEVNKIRHEHERRIEELMTELDSRDEQIRELNEQLLAANTELITTQQENRKLTEAKDKLNHSEGLLTIQLNHIERELASLTKSCKIKDSSLNNLKRKLAEQKMLLEESQLVNENLKNDLGDSQRLERDLKAEIIDTNNSNINITLKLDEVVKEKEELWIRNQELTEKLANSDSISNAKYEKLVKQLDELDAAHARLKSHRDRLEESNRRLEREIEEKEATIQKLKDDNTTNERLIKEYDEVATTKIHEIETERDEAFQQCLKLQESIKKLEHQAEQLHGKVDETEHSNSKLQLKIDELEAKAAATEELQELESRLSDSETRLKECVAELEKKNETIKEYLEKMDQLVDSVESLKLQLNDSKDEKENLTKEIRELQEKADKEWDRLIEHLHAEYSRKHTEKVKFLKEAFTADIEKIAQDKKTLEREVEFLKAKIDKGNEEAKYLRERINSLNEDPSATRLNPKVTSTQPRKRTSNN
ncbi:Autophagy-related protein 23 [Candida viswanathii]|uniref:Autophagy-related protein 23 n=1 Tax=Candida viswanathii TaxID=5486 RepID=A0A367Y223_9ASCO|nr:Autophagy-related protein 23 [Candida viswanathii]